MSYFKLLLLFGVIFLFACKSKSNAFLDEAPVAISTMVTPPKKKQEPNCEALRKQFLIPEGQPFDCDSLNKIVETNGISF